MGFQCLGRKRARLTNLYRNEPATQPGSFYVVGGVLASSKRLQPRCGVFSGNLFFPFPCLRAGRMGVVEAACRRTEVVAGLRRGVGMFAVQRGGAEVRAPGRSWRSGDATRGKPRGANVACPVWEVVVL